MQQVQPDEIVNRVMSEFREMPGLKVTEAQARRLFGIGETQCREMLRMLLDRRLLAQTRDGAYVLLA